MEQKIYNYIEKYHMIEKNDRIVAAVSGGADSVCLFRVLYELRETYALTLFLVHVNHGIRGEAAAADQKFVELLGEKYNIKVRTFQADVRGYALEKKVTEEEAGRSLRYEFFYKVFAEEKATKIAVAHNSNDNAETMLFHLARGSGIKGLTGIAPVRNEIIRPLLCVSRDEIENYLKDKKQPYCTDATNFTDDYTRNRIRHHIIPALKHMVNEKAVEHMEQTCELLMETWEYLEKNVKNAYKQHVSELNGQYSIKIADFKEEDTIIQKGVLREILMAASGRLKDIENRHISQLIALLYQETGKKVNLPYGLLARKEYDRLYIGKSFSKEEVKDYEICLFGSGEYEIPGTDMKISVTIEECLTNLNEIPKNDYTKWFDYDKIIQYVFLRNRRKGDYLQITGEGGTKKLKDYFIDRKIPRESRNSIPLLAEGSHIIWVLGDRISEKYKITENTKTILKVNLIGGKRDEYQGYDLGRGTRKEDCAVRGTDQQGL